MELFIAGLAVGGLLGVRGKGLVKSVAKGYFLMVDRGKVVGKSLREDFRDAVEEAKYEHEHQAIQADEEAEVMDGHNGHHADHGLAVNEVHEIGGMAPAPPAAAGRKRSTPNSSVEPNPVEVVAA